jgi:4-carboxymuconolactone decarboxylase
MSSGDRFQQGVDVQARLDPSITEKLLESLAEIAPDFGRLTVEFPYGDIYSRPGLDLRSRQIATIAALVTLGGAEAQLRVHIGFALNVGLSSEEIVEVIMQMAVYAGWPRALEALRTAKTVFEERGVPLPGT